MENECVCFHTGLYTPQYKGIYGYFERNNFSDSLRDWYFRGFCDELSPKLRYIEPLPQKPVFRISDKLVERLDAEENIPLEKVIQIAEEESIEGLAFGEDRIFFCGFPLNEDEARAYAELAACMAKTAKEAKRVSPKATIEENEKYYMRVWLVRIGLGGKDGKETRKVFLSRLKGHTAFRTEEDKEKWKERNSKKSTESAE